MNTPQPRKHLDRERDATAARFYEALSEGRLTTTRCESCEVVRFPPRARCAACSVETAWIDLPLRGRLHAFTTQETALRFGAPVVLALAEVGPVVVPGISRSAFGELSVGQEVDVVPEHVEDLGLHVCRFDPAP